MKTVFMGTPEIAAPVLEALLEAGHEVVSVHTRPDRPAGRGKRRTASPVKEYALERGLPVFQPASLRTGAAQMELAELSPELIVVAAYGLFLPSAVLSLPPLGCLNVHPSLLPRYRGPSPVAAAILSGDATTGVTVIKLDEGMDSGPIVARRETEIGPEENAEGLAARLFRLGAQVLVEVLPDWAAGRLQAIPQDKTLATTTRLLSREDGEIDWDLGAVRIARQVRAYHPWPGAYTRWQGKQLKIIEASAWDAADAAPARPGRVVSLPSGGLGIAASEGVLQIRRIQLEGRRAAAVREFVWGYPEFVGSMVGEK
ncbi:MAG: methionyl-tRNA formyltransferase [Candidatus Brocadiia bacterium]|nr:methionyl-tRNA formyltransferase [Candidatus Brocadiia bacterium]